MPRTILTFVIIAVLLTACGSVPATPSPISAPNLLPSSTPALPTLTPTPVVITPSVTFAPESQTQEFQIEIINANKEAFQNYFEDVFYGLNRDSKYFEAFGIETKEQFDAFLAQNNGILPPSPTENDTINMVINTQRNDIELAPKALDKSLNINLKLELTNNKNDSMRAEFFPNVNTLDRKSGDDTTTIYYGIENSEIENQDQLKLSVNWKDNDFNLLGRKTSNTDKTTITNQTNFLFKTFLYLLSCYEEDTKLESVDDRGSFDMPQNVTLVRLLAKNGIAIMHSNNNGKIKSIFYYPFFRKSLEQIDNPNIKEELPPNIINEVITK